MAQEIKKLKDQKRGQIIDKILQIQKISGLKD